MNSRIFKTFQKLKINKEKGFIPFITAGDPDLNFSLEILKSLPNAGADLIEIGMPFSDPMADGETIQASSLRALSKGITVEKILQMISKFRKINYNTPIILMGYFNPIYNYGVNKFLSKCQEIGIDGLIIVDLPYEHDNEVCIPAKSFNIDFIRLIAPTTTTDRIPLLLNQSSGFVYCISLSGITGSKIAKEHIVQDTIERIKKVSNLPIAVGFGIKTPEQARTISVISDATVIGSALIKKINETHLKKLNNEEKLAEIITEVNFFSNAIHLNNRD
tara:strand:- start:234 stop:1061 length:828 start_codon:yes stop_codon:yes gene_type:complete